MARRTETVLIQRYSELTRLAYLMLAGEKRREDRLARAHGLVQSSLPWFQRGGDDPAEIYRFLLARVIERTLGKRRWHWPRSIRRLRATPLLGGPEHATVDNALAGTKPAVRAAYVLLVGEAIPADAVISVLAAARLPEPPRAVKAAQRLCDKLEDQTGLGREAQAALLRDAPLDPTIARLRAPDLLIRRGVRSLAIGGTAVIVAVSAIGLMSLRTDPTTDTTPVAAATNAIPSPQVVPATAWRATARSSVDVWPTRGNLSADKKALTKAVTAWNAGKSGPPRGEIRVLYAGTIDGQTVVLLSDDQRIARYVATGQNTSITVSPKPRPDASFSSALRLADTSAGTRYLLAPWVTTVAAAAPGQAWRPLTTADGVTAAFSHGGAGAACWTGPTLRLTAASINQGTPFTVADFGGVSLPHAMYVPPAVSTQFDRPLEADSADGMRTWAGLGCSLADLRGPALESVTVWTLWTGVLPEVGAARWTCTRSDAIDGSNGVRADLLTTGSPAHRTASRATTALCSRMSQNVVTSGWWQAPSKRWYFLAAASRNVSSLQVTGLPGTVQRSPGLAVVGPFAAPLKSAKVTVKATAVDRSTVPVLN